jgi:D-alanyl-D-alanine carboxypeptidase
VEDALKAMVVRSANDAAVVLAEAVAQSEQGFALMMTAKARSLGMRDTRFTNASGLPDPQQVTTARDMAVLARALIRDFPDHYPLFGSRSFRYHGRDHAATNRWAAGYPGADGIKTGFTCASGYNLAASAWRDGHRLISILLGARSSAIRNVTTSRLLDEGFERLAAGNDGRLRVEELVARGGRDLAAPTVLPGSACIATPTHQDAEAPLSGWGVIFGSFRDRERAKALARARQGELASVIDGGRIAVVPKNRDGYVGHSALIVGLSRDDAGRACRHLWEHDAYCLSLAPRVLQNPNALWR